jgi:amino acid adenylation domain-containing protein
MAYLLQQLLTRTASKYPDNTAVWARGESLSYRELNERSNQLAHLLRERGVRKGDRVGIYFPKAVESLVSMFGVLKAGGVYVPLDPQQPAQRIQYIVDNCGIKALVTTREKVQSLDPAAIPTVEFCVFTDRANTAGTSIPGISWEELASFPSAAAPEGLQSTTLDLAYILYTSGSTGRPKGVMLSHRNALTFIEWCADIFEIKPEDHLSSHAPLHFDLSVFDVYNAVEAGATVYMVPEDAMLFPATLAKFIAARGISVWYSVPSALVHLILHGKMPAQNLERLRIMLFAGEIFPIKYLRQLAELLPKVDLYNLYGPTETNVCTYYRVDRTQLPSIDKIPIGRACANTEVFAVDEKDQFILPGQTGELFVRGPSVTPGYWGDAEKTHKMVLPNRFQPNYEEKMYSTGDLVILREDGDYDFVGRRDSQIKSRGYRIELGEIEAALLSHPAVKEVAVVAVPDDEVSNRIKAFVAPHSGEALTAGQLQQHCAQRVPRYMIPELIEFRESLPKTTTGKLDRVTLAKDAVAVAT